MVYERINWTIYGCSLLTWFTENWEYFQSIPSLFPFLLLFINSLPIANAFEHMRIIYNFNAIIFRFKGKISCIVNRKFTFIRWTNTEYIDHIVILLVIRICDVCCGSLHSIWLQFCVLLWNGAYGDSYFNAKWIFARNQEHIKSIRISIEQCLKECSMRIRCLAGTKIVSNYYYLI